MNEIRTEKHYIRNIASYDNDDDNEKRQNNVKIDDKSLIYLLIPLKDTTIDFTTL